MTKKKYISDFKNDVLFNYLLADDRDPDCRYLLKLLIEDILHVDCSKMTVTHPDLNPQSVDDKEMVLDIRVRTCDDEDINVEMQNSRFNQRLYQRFQIYGAKMLTIQENRGGTYIDAHHVYQIIFIDDIDKDNLVLIDEYISRNKRGLSEKYYLITRVFVYLPHINIIHEKKPLSEFSELELIIYILENGLDDGIMKLANEVIRIMKEKEDSFNQNEVLQDMAYKRELNRKMRLTHERDMYEKGLQAGVLKTKYESIVTLFQSIYPNVDIAFLDGLTLEIYNQIFHMLIQHESLEKIIKLVNTRK